MLEKTYECKPRIIDVHFEPYGDDVLIENEYNCETCTKRNCKNWYKYNLSE